ncbi:MAG: hypothetical protein JSR39_02170 [Verrucomicrobia bacterium]|nr:hypothetical protein [Verrucomicrobiota bacterium]
MSAPIDPTVQADYNSWQNDVNETNYLNTEMQQKEARLQEVSGMMGTLPAESAFTLIPLFMLMVSNIDGVQQVSIPASQANEEADANNLVTLTQSDDNYLASNANTYATGTNPDGSPMTQSQQDEYQDTYNQSIQAQAALNTMFSTPGWCDPNYANNMTAAIDSWQSATNNLSTYNSSTDTYGGDNPSYYYAQNINNYAQDPSSSPYGADANNLETSLNTESSLNNSIQSQLQGTIKTGISLMQQYEGSTKSCGAAMLKEKDYWVQQQGKNS